MGRSTCTEINGIKKGPWTPEEDQKLVTYMQKNGHGSWRALPRLAGLNRCGKSCRLRWSNYLRPDIKRGKFSQEEEQTILNLHSFLGNKWSAIATHLPGRTDNEIKNFWNTHLKKKLIQMGFDPVTHRPRTDLFSSLSQLLALAHLNGLVIMNHHQWDEHAVRLQLETAQLARLQNYFQYLNQPTATMTTSSSTITGTTDMENMNLMNSASSIEGNPIWDPSQFVTPTLCSLGVETTQRIDNSISFSQLQDLQVPSTSKTSLNSEFNLDSDITMFSHVDITPSSQWVPLNNSSIGQLMETSTSNPRDASSSSSYEGGAPSFWPELFLEDSFTLEIA